MGESLELVIESVIKDWIKNRVSTKHYQELFFNSDFSSPHTQTSDLCELIAKAVMKRLRGGDA